MDEPSLKLVIVDDHAALSRGVEQLLRAAGHFVVGTAVNAEYGAELIRRRRPDLAIVDLGLPGESGVALCKQIRDEHADVDVLIYTGAADEATLERALDSDAQGIALKASEPKALVEAVATIARGGVYLDARLQPLLARRASSKNQQLLSPREREILSLLSTGVTAAGMASQLHLSPETVRTHLRNAMRKLAARTRVQAVVTALHAGELATGD